MSTNESLDPQDPSSNENKRNLLVLGSLVLIVAATAIGYLVWASGRVDGDLAEREARAAAVVDEFEAAQPAATSVPDVAPTPAADLGPTEPVAQPGEVLVVNRVPGDDYGRLAIRHVDGTRTLLERSCLRIHLNAGNGLCLSEDEGFLGSYRTTFYQADDPHKTDLRSYASALPSRARVSPDGSLSTVTAFVSGASYEDIGGDATTIVTIDHFDESQEIQGANQFVVDSSDSKYGGADNQYWGLSFVDNNDFYITGFFGDGPEIMTGSIDTLTVAPTGWAGSCPSLSPDGKTLVFKESRPEGGFDLVAVNVETNAKWQLGETRSVDDQVEWLDNDTILYALHPDGDENPVQPEFDIWMLDVAEGSEPVLFLPNADSPAVVR